MESNSTLKMTKGDLVSGRGSTVGTYLGQQEINLNGKQETFCAVYDSNAESKFLIPLDRKHELNRLPSKTELLARIENFPFNKTLIKVPTGEARYKSYSQVLSDGQFENVFAVTNDLHQLKIDKNISKPERALLERSKKTFLRQVGLVLNKSESVLNNEFFDKN